MYQYKPKTIYSVPTEIVIDREKLIREEDQKYKRLLRNTRDYYDPMYQPLQIKDDNTASRNGKIVNSEEKSIPYSEYIEKKKKEQEEKDEILNKKPPSSVIHHSSREVYNAMVYSSNLRNREIVEDEERMDERLKRLGDK